MIIRKDKSFNTQLSPYQKNKPRTARIFIEQLTIKLRNKLNNTVIFYWITIKAKLKETQISLPTTPLCTCLRYRLNVKMIKSPITL